MSVITPSSNVTLLKCPLEMDNNHQLNFSNTTAQHNYFKSLPKIDIGDDFTYIRQDNVIRVEAGIDEILHYNYVMYQNEAYSNKWFYAFITDMVYLNDNCTAIYFKLDTWQTWQFDLTFRKCYVEREHVNNDTYGLHTIPENFELGEYICNKASQWEYTNREYMICMQVTQLPNNYDATNITNKYYNRLVNGCWVLGFPYSTTGVNRMNKVIKWYDSDDKADAILALYVAPKGIINWNEVSVNLGSLGTIPISFPEDSNYSTIITYETFEPLTTLNGYAPKNNKLRCYPFNYLSVSNCNGDIYTYNFEEFNSSQSGGANIYPKFEIDGALTQGCAVKMFPLNYNQTTNNIVTGWDYGINGGKFPILSWTSDYYLNWQAQNGKYIQTKTAIDAAGFGLGIIGGMFTGYANASTGLLSMASSVADTMQQVRAAQMVPDQAKGNTATGDLNFSFGADRFIAKQMCIKAEYAKIIDDYFTMYGYKVNTLKVPNITGRQNWNYVKTIDVNIIGDVPQDDIAEIKSYFDRGITIWHNPSTFLDYNQSNNIV